MSEEAELEEDEGSGRRRGIKTLRDVQKVQLEKLMANPDKPVPIPERPKDWKPRDAPDFVRFYMGSSAGAGSEVFHVYRHLRRRENIRQQWISETAQRDDKDTEFQEKLASNRKAAEEKTAKKRAKRLKRKQRKLEKKTSSSKEGASKGEGGAKGEVGRAKGEEESEEEGGGAGSSGEEEEEPHFVIGGR